MKKILLFLLLSSFCFGQYTLYRNGYPSRNGYECPITYNDYNDTTFKIQSFIQEKLLMHHIDKGSDSFNKGNKTIIVNNFESNSGTTYLEKLQVREYVFTIGAQIIVEKLEIIGDYDPVLNFWAYFWTGIPKFKTDQKSNYVAEYRVLYDVVRLSRFKNGFKLVVTNSNYTPESFIKKMEEWELDDKSKQLKQDSIKQIKQEVIPEKPQVFQKAYSEANQYIQVSFSKNKKGISFDDFKIIDGDNVNFDIKNSLQEQINRDFASDGNGTYTAFYDVFYINNEPKKIKLKSRLNR